mgnify:CR=1 FL=1
MVVEVSLVVEALFQSREKYRVVHVVDLEEVAVVGETVQFLVEVGVAVSGKEAV